MSISVLVVEDHAELRTQLCELLQKEGYDVRSATTVEEAVATLSLMPPPCLVLWDPVTLRMSAELIAHTVRHGVHVATIPVGVTSTRDASQGAPVISKRLTNRDVILSVVKEHCPLPPIG
jgi:DNA-binding response OmpR family regulator